MDLSLFKPLTAASIKDEFVVCIEELILAGKILPGDRLPAERELASHYGVSRPLIHEGILTLENRGIVTLRPRHGVIVNNYRKEATMDMLLSLMNDSGRNPGPGLTADLEHFRIHIEKDIVSLICSSPGADRNELPELKVINRKMAQSNDADELAELDFQFHLQMALSSGNLLYTMLYNTLKAAHMGILSSFYDSEKKREQVVRFHDELISALLSNDEESAVAIIAMGDSYSGYR